MHAFTAVAAISLSLSLPTFPACAAGKRTHRSSGTGLQKDAKSDSTSEGYLLFSRSQSQRPSQDGGGGPEPTLHKDLFFKVRGLSHHPFFQIRGLLASATGVSTTVNPDNVAQIMVSDHLPQVRHLVGGFNAVEEHESVGETSSIPSH